MRAVTRRGRTLALLCALVLFFQPLTGSAAELLDDAALSSLTADELRILRSRIDDRLRAMGEYPFVKLSEGSKGDEVTALQTRLKGLGYFSQEPDGRYRATTVNAMKAFEKAMGLKRDGVATVDDQILLFADAAPAAPTPTPSPTPKPTRTPSLSKDYGVLNYRLAGLMPDKYAGERYRMDGTVIAFVGDRWLVELSSASGGLVLVENAGVTRAEGAEVRVWAEYAGLATYSSQSGPVTLPLMRCEHVE